MRATMTEFRLRMAINAAIIVLGFWSPWIEKFNIGTRMPSLEWLALELSRTGLLPFTEAVPLFIVLGAGIAGIGALLRIWGTAYLGSGTVQSVHMRAETVVAAGPYRYVRNPLYLGLWCMAAALAFMMPPTGALVTMTLLTIFLLRLILGEEAHLGRHLGEPYRAYCATVPRLLPCLRTIAVPGANKPQWIRGILAELLPIGVFFTLAVLSWSYNNRLMSRAVLISFGISLVVRALLPGKGPMNAGPPAREITR